MSSLRRSDSISYHLPPSKYFPDDANADYNLNAATAIPRASEHPEPGIFRPPQRFFPRGAFRVELAAQFGYGAFRIGGVFFGFLE
jgi:hypothetical protein